MLRDLVFDPVLSQFTAKEEEVPYPDDEPILGRKTISDAFDKTEDKFSNLLTAAAWSETDRYLKKIDKGLEKAARHSTTHSSATRKESIAGF